MNIKVSPQETKDVLFQLKDAIYPNSIKLAELTRIVYGTSTDIQQRKVRLAIAELRKRGYPIIAKRGYSMMGDDPEPAIHFVNGLYSRAHKLTAEADIMYGLIKQKYGDAVSEKVHPIPGQPMIDDFDVSQCKTITREELFGEPAYQKFYSKDGTLHNV